MKEITKDELVDLDQLLSLAESNNKPMAKSQQERLRWLQSKVYHNQCLNPRCVGYYAKDDDEMTCPHCGHNIHKAKITGIRVGHAVLYDAENVMASIDKSNMNAAHKLALIEFLNSIGTHY